MNNPPTSPADWARSNQSAQTIATPPWLAPQQAAPTQQAQPSYQQAPRPQQSYANKPKAVKHLRFVLGEPSPQFQGRGDTLFGSLTPEGQDELWNLANQIVQGQVKLEDVRLRINTYSFIDEIKQTGQGYFQKPVGGGVFSIRKPR